MTTQSMAISICTGDSERVLNIPDWKNPVSWDDNWTLDFCFQTFDDIMFQGPDRLYDPVALRTIVQPNMQLVLNRFNGMYQITEPGDRPIEEFGPAGIAALTNLQNQILSACQRLPGACDTFLTGPLISGNRSFPMPAPYCQNLTRDEIAGFKPDLQFCGCFSPPIVSQKVEQEIGNVKSCDPLCQRIDTIQLPDGKGAFMECPDDTVCVINAVSITAAMSEVGGSVNFEQICTCKESCRCVIESESDIEKTLSEIGLSGNFEQLCGQNSTCILFNQMTDTDTYVTCPGADNGGNNVEQNQKTVILFWTIAVIFVVIVLIVSLFVGLNVSKRS